MELYTLEELKKLNIIKESLFLALIRLMREKHFSDISISELTKTAGVSRMSFYRYYSSKEEILQNYFKEQLEQNYMKTLKMKKKTTIIEAFFEFLGTQYELISLLQKTGQAGILNEVFREYLALHFDQVMTKEQIRYKDYLIASLEGIIWNMGLVWIQNGMKETPRKMVGIYERIVSVHLNPLNKSRLE